MLAGLAQWARALRPLGETAPGEPAGGGRPSLHQATVAADAEAAVSRLVNELQAGLDNGDADRYDGMFAKDVLWGSPYGRVLAGFPRLSAAHHSFMGAPASTVTSQRAPDPIGLVRTSQGFVRTAETLELVRWLREYNLEHPGDPARVFHADGDPAPGSPGAVEDHLADVDLRW